MEIYHEPTVEYMRNWFIVAVVIAVVIGSALGVVVWNSEGEKFRQHQSMKARNMRSTRGCRRLDVSKCKKTA